MDNAIQQPAEEINTDLFEIYFELVDDSSECPFLYHRWTLISAVAALLGRDAFMKFGFDTIYPNMYICLMGSAGTRKSSAIKITRSILEGTGFTKFARERSSKEKFIKDLAVGFDVINGHTENQDEMDIELYDDVTPFAELPPAEVYISAGELEDFLGQSDGAFISLLTNLWDNLPKYGHGKLSSADIWIKEPTLNLIGGCTPVTFNSVFPPEVIGQGMLSRLLLIYGGGVRKKITIPKAPDETLLQFFIDHLIEIKNTMGGEYKFDDEAFKVFDTIYQGDIDLQDQRLESYLNRRHIHFYKLCLIIAAMQLTKTITKEIAIEANTILHYTERLMPKALGEFGKSFKADNAAIVMQALESHYNNTGEGLKLDELFTLVSTNFDSFGKDFADVIQKLKAAHKIKVREGTQQLIPNANTQLKEIPYVNFELMREYREEQ